MKDIRCSCSAVAEVEQANPAAHGTSSVVCIHCRRELHIGLGYHILRSALRIIRHRVQPGFDLNKCVLMVYQGHVGAWLRREWCLGKGEGKSRRQRGLEDTALHAEYAALVPRERSMQMEAR